MIISFPISVSSLIKSLLLNLRNLCSRSQQGNREISPRDPFSLLTKQLTRRGRCFNGVLVTRRSELAEKWNQIIFTISSSTLFLLHALRHNLFVSKSSARATPVSPSDHACTKVKNYLFALVPKPLSSRKSITSCFCSFKCRRFQKTSRFQRSYRLIETWFPLLVNLLATE